MRGTVNGETTVYIGGIYEYSPVADTLTLSNQTLTGTDTYETVSSGADITFHLFRLLGGARSRCNRASTPKSRAEPRHASPLTTKAPTG